MKIITTISEDKKIKKYLIINTIFMIILMLIIILNLYTIYNYTDNVNHKYTDKNIEIDFNILLK